MKNQFYKAWLIRKGYQSLDDRLFSIMPAQSPVTIDQAEVDYVREVTALQGEIKALVGRDEFVKIITAAGGKDHAETIAYLRGKLNEIDDPLAEFINAMPDDDPALDQDILRHGTF